MCDIARECIYTICKTIFLVTVYLSINASKYNLNETTKNACITNSKNRANFLEFLVYFIKKKFFLKKANINIPLQKDLRILLCLFRR